MKRQGLSLVAVALGALLVGALLLKGVAKEGPSDPTASADNGAPQGLLALALLLEGRDIVVERRRDFDAPFDDTRALLVVPPPEGSAWTDAEVERELARVRTGALDVIVLCDEDPLRVQRLGAWERALGARCTLVEAKPVSARGTLPAWGARLFVRGPGRVTLPEDRAATPAWLDEDDRVVVMRQRIGAGAVTLVGSTTVLANDGLVEADNAAFFLGLVPEGARVLFDEAHHTFRSAEVLDEAFSRTGPRVALVVLLLLVPAVLLGFAPRRGDPPPSVLADDFLAVRASAEALAGLYRRARVDITAPTSPEEEPRHDS